AQNVSDLTMLPGATYIDPKFSIVSPIGITDLGFLANFNYDARYENAVIFGGSNGTNNNRLFMLRLNAARDGFTVSGGLTDLVADDAAELSSIQFGSAFGVATDIQIGPDNAIYVLSLSNGAIYRIASNATFILGDMNGDGVVNNFDIFPFEQGLASTSQYLAQFPALVNFKMRGDISADHTFNNFDVHPFELILASSSQPVAEPPALWLGMSGLAMLLIWRDARSTSWSTLRRRVVR